MDTAYDAKTIKDFIIYRQRIPIIAPNKRKNQNCVPLASAKQERYKIRSTVERANSHVKDIVVQFKYFGKI